MLVLTKESNGLIEDREWHDGSEEAPPAADRANQIEAIGGGQYRKGNMCRIDGVPEVCAVIAPDDERLSEQDDEGYSREDESKE